MSEYSLEELKRKLGNNGWRTRIGDDSVHVEGTLGQVVEAAHARRGKGHSYAAVEEIETEIKLDMLQLAELWRHMGLPII